MASSVSSSSSSSVPRTWSYRVFASFHGPDVRKTFLSHLRKQFNENGITLFDDHEIKRGETITPALEKAIRESRILIVVLSKNYASSGWCLDELLEILKCKKDTGQTVMTVFHGVDPSDVRKQTGEFGREFNKTCALKTEEESRRWSQALTDAANIAGEHFQNWDNELKMIVKIARDVSNKLNTTVSRDFEDMVGLEAHLKKVQSLLHLDNEDGAMIVGICGPAGIGKTTIARALHSRLCRSFQLTCFMENLRGNPNSGIDEYGLKLYLQEKLLSKIFNQNGMRIYHLGTIQERLCDQKVLIILDDVDDLKQLEALAKETNWFGPGSRIIVTTEDNEILAKHGINNTYHVAFPTGEEARKIVCRYAFKQSYPLDGFEKLAERVTKLCSNLPLGQRIMGSSLRGKNQDEWEAILHRLENSLDREIAAVLRVGYDNLHKDDQLLFLLIAFFFNYKDDDHVMSMLVESNLDVRLGLTTLVRKSLIQITTTRNIVMHKLLQQVGRESIQRQEPSKRHVLIEADEICDVLETESGTRSVMGITFDISKVLDDVYISASAFKRMRNLRFLRVYKTIFETNDRIHVHQDMEFPPRLRLFHWEVYPGKCLPRTFNPEYLVELSLQHNKLEKLWGGTQPLLNLKKMDLLLSSNLKELPDLSNATNLETLELSGCFSLKEIPTSIGNLHKLEWLKMVFCIKLQVVPTHFSLASLVNVDMLGCWQLKTFPDISTNITELRITDTMFEQVPESFRLLFRLHTLSIYGSVMTSTYVAETFIERNGADVEIFPDCIKYLDALKNLYICGCPKLASLPELPSALREVVVDTCESLETVSLPFNSQIEHCYFGNCFKLCHEARRVIIQQSLDACLPGRKIPAVFGHQAIGYSLIIRSDFNRFRICVLVSPKQIMREGCDLLCCTRLNGCSINNYIGGGVPDIRTEHLFIYYSKLLDEDGWLELDNEIYFEFSTTSQNIQIIECGVQILTEETWRSSQESYEFRSEQVSDGSIEFDEPKVKRLKTCQDACIISSVSGS